MRRVLALALLLISPGLGCTLAGPGGPGRSEPPARLSEETRIRALHEAGVPKRVVLVTVAGLEAGDFLQPDGFVAVGSDAVRMPFLASLAAEGAIGVEVLPPPPGASYAAHATLVTGLRPDRHGIVADEALDEAGDRTLPFWDSRLLRGLTLWDAALGRGVLALGWPSTDGARIELLVPDAAPSDPRADWLGFLRGRSTPRLASALEEIAKSQKSARSSGRGGAKRADAAWPTPGERDGALVELACEVAVSDSDPALSLIRLVEPAVALVGEGWGTAAHAEAMRRTDTRLARLASCLDGAGRLADAALVVVGDVAYRPVHTEISPNTVLVREELIGRDPRTQTGLRSWLALARSHGRSAYVHAQDAESALTARRALEAEAAKSGAFEVVPAAELAAAGADREAWFGLAARPGYGFGNALMGPLLRPAELRSRAGDLGIGRDAAEGAAVGLVAWGRGVRGGVRLPRLAQADLAVTIASLLGLRLEDDVAGRKLTGILRASQSLPPPGPKRIGVGSDGDVERTLRDLSGGRALGDE